MEIAAFLPGILGSELRTADNRKVWPPTVGEAVGELDDWKITALLDETPLRAPNAVEKVCLKTVYRGVLNDIEDAGFPRNGHAKRLVVLPYDWRLDIVDAIAPAMAHRLDELVSDGADCIHLIAHSMGGLVARVLLQDPRYANRPWRTKVSQLITIASPFKGAPLAVARLLGMEKVSGIPGRAFVELREKPALCAAYQLMPPPGTPMLWTIEGTAISTLDLYGAFGAENGFLPDSLDSIKRMHAILDGPWPIGVSAFQFAGTGFTTVTRLARADGVRRVFDDFSGDETVPLISAASSRIPTMILPGEHLDIVNNRKLRRTLRALLGADDGVIIFSAEGAKPFPEPQSLQLSVPALGVPSIDGTVSTELLLTLAQPLDDTRVIILEVEGVDRHGDTDPRLPQVERNIAVNAGATESTVRLDAPLLPGQYRLRARMPDGTAGETFLIVRDE